MDTSETYIKMRLAAIPDLGRGVSHGKPSYYYTERAWVDVYGNWYYTDKLPCQLERQDQLQEMVKYYHNKPPAEYSVRGLLEVFWYFVDMNWENYLWTMSDEQVSMEQLWLAFVMKEKYNKVWDGEQWLTT